MRELVIDVEIQSGEREGKAIFGMPSGELEKGSCSCERRNLISSLQFVLIGG